MAEGVAEVTAYRRHRYLPDRDPPKTSRPGTDPRAARLLKKLKEPPRDKSRGDQAQVTLMISPDEKLASVL